MIDGGGAHQLQQHLKQPPSSTADSTRGLSGHRLLRIRVSGSEARDRSVKNASGLFPQLNYQGKQRKSLIAHSRVPRSINYTQRVYCTRAGKGSGDALYVVSDAKVWVCVRGRDVSAFPDLRRRDREAPEVARLGSEGCASERDEDLSARGTSVKLQRLELSSISVLSQR